MAGHSRAGWDCELFGADPPRLASAERSVADEGRLLEVLSPPTAPAETAPATSPARTGRCFVPPGL